MEYLFVYKNGGWWLKITRPEQLFDYWDKIDSRWSNVLDDLYNCQEFGKGMKHADYLTYAVGLYGEKRNLSMIQAVANFAGEIKGNQLDCLLEKGALFINSKGGYHFPHEKDEPYTQFYRKMELVWPEFEEKDIRIKRFPGGEHFYAYIGNVEVKNGDQIKWNTYEEAYKAAKELINK